MIENKPIKKKVTSKDVPQILKASEKSNYRPNQSPRSHSGKPHESNLPEISVVIPLLNEVDSLPELSLLLEEELAKSAKGRYEVIFVDDGSTDGSYDMIKQINRRNKRFKCIRFRRNYGKSAALSVAFQKAKGKVVITMDADLQDDPSEIPNLLSKINDGYDLVSGWKKKRYDPISKTMPSKLFNYVTSVASGIKLHDFNCGLKAYKKSVVKTVKIYGEMHRYIPALAHWEGFKVTEIPVQHHPRRYGKTKFGVSRFVYGFLDLLTVLFTTRYFKRPLHFFGAGGMLLTLLGLIINLYLTIEWFAGNTYLSNRPLALLGIALIIVGVQFISMGLIGEMMVKNHMLLNENNYSIKEILE
ncbi:MAG: glycosyltransferase [Candidatus Kapabacteria bacterium]|nr:glycosyltransferase [Ignavibacteriota bacterium]MCW5884313.1 glycosyltransferase [Candidatus Kapabacteria bacterium]